MPPPIAYRAAAPAALAPPPTGLRRWLPPHQAVRLITLGLALTAVAATVVARHRLPATVSRGCSGCGGGSALAQNLAILRNGLDLYATEHGGAFPAAADVADALTKYTRADGTIGTATRDEAGGFVYGPYLRVIPPQSEGPERGRTRIGPAAAPGVAWVYDPVAGTVTANAPGRDATGRPYAGY